MTALTVGHLGHPEPADDSWRPFALCKETDPAIFFPEPGSDGAEAKRVCAKCPVDLACLASALARPEKYGVWGGKTEGERDGLRRAWLRRQAAGRRRAASSLTPADPPPAEEPQAVITLEAPARPGRARTSRRSDVTPH